MTSKHRITVGEELRYDADLSGLHNLSGTYGQLWASPAASTTLTGTLAAWVITSVDCTTGAGARTLPAASSVTAGTAVCAKKADTSTNALVVSRAGSDLIYGTGSGATAKTLSLAGEAVEFVSNGVDKWTIRASDTPSGVLAATFVQKGALLFSVLDYLPSGATQGDGTQDRIALQAALDAAVSAITSTGRRAVVDLNGLTWYLNTDTTVSTSPTGYGKRPVGIRLPVNLANVLTIQNGTVKLSTSYANIAFWINQAGGYGTDGSTTSGSNQVTVTPTQGAFAVGQVIRGSGITDTTTITAVSGNTLTLSSNATATATGVTLTSYAYDVFKNVTFRDIFVDNNNATGRCAILVGNRPAASTPTRYLSFQDIRVEGCGTANVPADPAQTTTIKAFVQFMGVHNGPGESPQTYSKRITVTDCEIDDAQTGVDISTPNTLVSNHYYDDIKIRHCNHRQAAPPATTLAQTSFFICGGGLGGYGEVVDCYSKNIGDDGVEIGAMQRVLIDRFRCQNPWLEGIYFRQSQNPPDPDTQVLTVRDSQTWTDSTLGAIPGAKGRSIAFTVDNAAYTFGEVRLQRLSHRYDGMVRSNAALNTCGINADAPARRIVLDECSAALTNYAYDLSSTQDHHLFHVRSSIGTYGTVIMRNCSAFVSTVTNSGGGTCQVFGIIPVGFGGSRIYIDGFDWQVLTSAVSAFAAILAYESGGAGFLGVRRLTGHATTAGSSRSIQINETGTITNGAIEGCDFRNLFKSGTVDVVRTAAGSNSSNVVERNNMYGQSNAKPVIAVSANYTAVQANKVILATGGASGITVTLPEAGPERRIDIIKDDSGAGAISVTAAEGANKIKSAGSLTTTLIISSAGGSLSLACGADLIWRPIS